ncbi:MAG: hypothetical protein WB523_02420 [Candidatus Sulfotelmatobacter sp.]
MKKLIFALLVVAVAAPGGYLAYKHGRTPQAAPYSCKAASPDEQCPSSEWHSDYERVMKFQEKYKPPKPPQAEADEMAGVTQRLISQVPPGYTFDAKKERFVKAAKP